MDTFLMSKNKKVIKYDFFDYSARNSQTCLSRETKMLLESLGFINEPYAWLMGQALKYMLKTKQKFDILLGEYINGLDIDFDQPIVG